MYKPILLTMMLATTTLAYSQNDTQTSEYPVDDTLVYVPQYLMESLMSDLDKCDMDRISLNKAKAELALLYVDLAKKDASVRSLSKELNSMREQRDTLELALIGSQIEHGKTLKKVKRSRNLWFTTSLGGFVGMFGVHQDWKNSWFSKILGKD